MDPGFFRPRIRAVATFTMSFDVMGYPDAS